MICRNCGSDINDNAVVCVHCGEYTTKKVPAATPSKPNPLAGKKIKLTFLISLITNGLSILSGLIICIFGLVSMSADSWIYQVQIIADARTMGGWIVFFGLCVIFWNGVSLAYHLFRNFKKKKPRPAPQNNAQ